MRLPLIVVLIAILGEPYANADGTKPRVTEKKAVKKITGDDLKMIARLHHVNAMEVELGKLAQKNGTMALATYVKNLITDHQANDKDLVALAKKRDTTIPNYVPVTEAEQIEAKDMDTQVAKLEKLAGPDFDTAFLAMMITGHESLVGKLAAAIAVTTDDDVKMCLMMTKPTVELHAKRARDLQQGKPQI